MEAFQGNLPRGGAYVRTAMLISRPVILWLHGRGARMECTAGYDITCRGARRSLAVTSS